MIPICPVHEKLLLDGHIEPLDNCVFCIRAHRDELRRRAAAFDRITKSADPLLQLLAENALKAVDAEAARLLKALAIVDGIGSSLPRRRNKVYFETKLGSFLLARIYRRRKQGIR